MSDCYSHIAVAKKLRAHQTGLTMWLIRHQGRGCMFLRKKNRRRVDVAKKTGELKAAAKHHAPTAFKVLVSAVVTGLLSYGAVLGHRFATTAQLFALSRVRVSGVDRASEAALVKLGGITLGTNLFVLDTGAIERALGAHPWVKHVTVRRRWPSTLSIEVTEHAPIAMMSLGDLYLVNTDGEPFKRVQATEPIDLPLLTGIEREDFVARREESLAAVRQALSIIEAYATSSAAKGHPLSEAHVDEVGVTLVTNNGEEIRLGQGGVPQKLERLERVRRELASRQLTAQLIRLDNRARPNWVTVQPRIQPTTPSAASEKSKR